MAPTQRAIELWPAVRIAIDQLSTIIAGPFQFDPAKSTALIRIAGTDGTMTCALVPVINEIQRMAPLMRFEVASLLHKRLQEPLETGVDDLALERCLNGVARALPQQCGARMVAAETSRRHDEPGWRRAMNCQPEYRHWASSIDFRSSRREDTAQRATGDIQCPM